MADKKAEPPKPRGYSKTLDLKLEDALSGVYNLYKPETQKKIGAEIGDDYDTLYINHHFKHFEKHGRDEKTKKFKRTGYADMSETDKIKWATDYLADLAMMGLTKEYNADIAKVMASDHMLLRSYVEAKMRTKDLDSFDKIVQHIAGQENLKDAFHNDDAMRDLVRSYLARINPTAKKEQDYVNRIGMAQNDAKEHKTVMDYANQYLKPHKKKLAPHANIEHALGVIQNAPSPGYAPKKSKFYEDIKEEKKAA
jgi:hypothetical protein